MINSTRGSVLRLRVPQDMKKELPLTSSQTVPFLATKGAWPPLCTQVELAERQGLGNTFPGSPSPGRPAPVLLRLLLTWQKIMAWAMVMAP